jgi:hypothetical protein
MFRVSFPPLQAALLATRRRRSIPREYQVFILFACLMPFLKNILDDEYVPRQAAQAPGKRRFPSFLPADSERVGQMLDLKHVIQLEKLVSDLRLYMCR